MTARTNTLKLEEIPGKKYNDLKGIQTAILPSLARLLAEAIRRGLENNFLKETEGGVVTNEG